jgi:hypothetical protein
MTKWIYKLDFSSFYQDDNISVEDKGKMISKQLQQLIDTTPVLKDNWDIEEIINMFDIISGYDDDSQVEVFDNWMEQLYDFSDAWRIWIVTQ